MRARAERGFALVLVLWVTVLLTLIVAAYATLARSEFMQSRFILDATRARLLAESGLSWAIVQLRAGDAKYRFVADGRLYSRTFDDVEVEVQVWDETGKIDLNFADEALLRGLFKSRGLEERDAVRLAAAVIDFRDPDDLTQPEGAEDKDYEQAGLPYGAKDAPFDVVEELQQVLGMNYEAFLAIEPAVTVYASRPGINPAFAPLEALLALPNMTPDLANQFIAARQQVAPDQVGLTPLPPLPDGQAALAQGGGLAYTVRSRAKLKNGTQSTLVTTIRMGGTPLRRPFQVLRWREIEAS